MKWINDELNIKMTDTADYIFRHPEISLKEERSSRRLAEFLESEGFKVTWGTAGFETAFTAEWSCGGAKEEAERADGTGKDPGNDPGVRMSGGGDCHRQDPHE